MAEDYNQSQTLGSYRTAEGQFPDPEGLKRFSGFGADRAVLARGFADPDIVERPEYDKANYHNRWTQPKLPDEDQGNTEVMPKDWEFRMRDLESKGFLTRPRLPTER